MPLETPGAFFQTVTTEQRQILQIVIPIILGALFLCLARLGPPVILDPFNTGFSWLYWILGIAVIVMAYGIFSVQWYQVGAGSKRRSYWMGLGCLTTGVLDVLYNIFYGGMSQPIFSLSGHEMAYLWLITRLLFALLWLVVPWLDYQEVYRPEKYLGLLFCLTFTAMNLYLVVRTRYLALIYSRRDHWLMPAPGFQVIIFVILLAAGWQYWRRWVRDKNSYDYYVFLALVCAVYAEVAFSLHGRKNDTYSLISQAYNVLCYGFLYYGFFALPLKQSYTKLALAYERLQKNQRMSMLGQISSRLNHEVKNYLASIKGFAQLGQLWSLDPKTAELFRRIEESVNDCMRLSAELSSLIRESRAAAPELIDVQELLQRIEYLWQMQVNGKNIELSFYYETEAVVRGYPHLLRSVLVNLLSNATQALETVGGGQIEVRVKQSGNDKSLHILVSDTGPGMPADIQRNVFEVLFTTKPEGTGLGLVICKEIVEDMHHGRIWFTSEQGKGTTFVVELPQA